MPELALGLWALHGVVNFVLRVALTVGRTGATGVVGVSGRLGPGERIGEGGIVLWIALGVAAPLLALDDSPVSTAALDVLGLQLLGAILALLGIAGVAASQEAMGRWWRIGVDPDERPALITAGPFSLVRHPIYGSFFLLQAGMTLLVPNLVSLLAFAVLVAAVEVQVRAVEEPHMLRLHGERYAEYGRRTGRFLPGLGRLR